MGVDRAYVSSLQLLFGKNRHGGAHFQRLRSGWRMDVREISAVRWRGDVEGLAIKKSQLAEDADRFGWGSGGIVMDLDRRVLQAIGRRRNETGKIKLKSRSRNFREGSGPGELSFCFSFILYKYIFNWFIFSYSFSLLYLIVTLRWKFWKKLQSNESH